MDEFSGMSPHQMGEMIYDWFKDDGFLIEIAEVPHTDFSWGITLSSKKIFVLKLKNKPDSIIIAGTVLLADKLDLIKQEKGNEIFSKLKERCMEFGFHYRFEPSSNIEQIQVMEIAQHIHYDGLTKHQLNQAVVRLRNIIMWAESRFEKIISPDYIKFKNIGSPLVGDPSSD